MLKIKTRNLIISIINLSILVGIIVLSLNKVVFYANRSGLFLNISISIVLAIITIILNAMRSESASEHKAIKEQIVSISSTSIYILMGVSFVFYLFIHAINAIMQGHFTATTNNVLQHIVGIGTIFTFIIGSVLSDTKGSALLVAVSACLIITVSGIKYVTMFYNSLPLAIALIFSPAFIILLAYLALKKTPLKELKLCKRVF